MILILNVAFLMHHHTRLHGAWKRRDRVSSLQSPCRCNIYSSFMDTAGAIRRDAATTLAIRLRILRWN